MGSVTYTYTTEKGMRYRISRYKAVQAKPIDRSLPLKYGKSMRLAIHGEGRGVWANTTDWEGTYFWREGLADYSWFFGSSGPGALPNYPAYNAAYAKAYGKFIESCSLGTEKSQMLTNLAERHETFEMVLSRMSQILKGATHLKRGELRDFFATFGIKPKKKHRDTLWSRPADFSALWLEYWFGWAPTFADLMAAFKTYTQAISEDWVIAKGSSARPIGTGETTAFTSIAYNGYSAYQRDFGTVRVRLSGRVAVDNAALFKMNQLGLLNPISTAWELIPFSWFAGWFGNVAQVLGQSSDMVGLKLQDLFLSVKAEWIHEYHMTYAASGSGVDKSIRQETYTRGQLTTLPRVSLVWKIPSKLSPTRGATLASLIVQAFAPTRKG